MRIRAWIAATATAATIVGGGAPVAAQSAEEEEVMIAAARWAQGRLTAGQLSLDPHRTGEGGGRAVAQRVARAIGADLAPLERVHSCEDVMSASTCRLTVPALLALATPRINGDQAGIRVYAWYRQTDPRQPVGKESWNLRLVREGSSWRVTSGGR